MATLANVFGVSHAACVGAAMLVLLAAALNIAALALPWWTGAAAGDLVNLSSETSTNSLLTLWTIYLQRRQDSQDGSATYLDINYEWDAYCNEFQTFNSVVADVCMKISIMRAAGFLALLFSMLSFSGALIALFTSPLLAVLCAGAATFTFLFCAAELVVGILVGTSGLSYGFVIQGIALVLGFAAIGVSLYAAGKEVKAEASREVYPELSRQIRNIQARLEAQQNHAKLANNVQKRRDSRRSSEGSIEKQHVQRVPVYLQKVLFWGEENPSGPSEEIPSDLLELAFREIDGDATGLIAMEELVQALNLCGLNISQNAAEQVMLEIDKNVSGDIDIHEFVEFFRHIEDLSRFQKKSASRAQFATIMLNVCFLLDIVLVGLLLMFYIRMPSDSASDAYTLLRTGLIVFSFLLFMLFVCVVAMPAAKLTLKPTITAIVKHYAPRNKKKKRNKETPTTTFEKAKDEEEGTWQPPVAPAAVHPEMIAQSYRHVGRAQQMVDTAKEVQRLQLQNGPRQNVPSPVARVSPALSSPSPNARPSYTGQAMILDESGEFIRYDDNAYRQAAAQYNAKPMTTFSALQVRSEIETAMYNATITGSSFHAAPAAHEPQHAHPLAIAN